MEIMLAIVIVLLVVALFQMASVRRAQWNHQADWHRLEHDVDTLSDHVAALIKTVKGKPVEQKPGARPQEPEPPPIPPAAELIAPPRPPPLAVADKVPVPPMPEIPVIPPIPKPESKLVQSVREILRRIWQWVLVGEEYRREGVAMEQAVATTWLMRAGIVIVVTGVACFLKWSIERDLIGPPLRVAISIAFGIGMLVGGLKLLGRRWNVLGQGFIGGGLATLYFSMYAMGPMYHLLDSPAWVFLLMVLVTLAAGVLALQTGSTLIAIFGIIGGFCTPIVLRTAEPNFAVLYSYLLLLSLGILGLSCLRQWRLLNYLGFAFTWMIYFGSLQQYKRPDFPVVMTFLALFFVVHSLLVFIYNIRRAVPTTILEIIHLVLNAALFSWSAYSLIHDAVGRPYPALMTLGLAVYYMLHLAVFLKRRIMDRTLLVTLITLCVFYTTLTMPLVMEKESLTIAWSLLAFMFLWLGRQLDSNFLRHLGYVVYGITFVRLLCFEIPRFEMLAPAGTPIAVYWKAMAGRLWTFGLALASVSAAFFLETKSAGGSEARLPEGGNDTPDFVPGSIARHVFFWGLVGCLFIYLHLEFYTMFGYFTSFRPAVLTAVWCAAAVFFLAMYLRQPHVAPFVALLVFACGAVVKSLTVDMASWHLGERFYFVEPACTPFSVFARWFDFLVILAFMTFAWRLLARRKTVQIIPAVFGYAALALLWTYLTLEVNSLLHWRLPDFQSGGVSILWTLFALGFVAGGIWKNVRAVRYLGLALFAVVAGKVFLVDLSHMPAVYRVIAFMVVGILLLLGSFAYLYASKRFGKGELRP